MTLVLLYLSVALGISFLCSILEAVLLSTPMSFISMKENDGAKSAPLLKQLKANIDRPISAILSLNTIAHTIGAAGVGTEATKVFGEAYFGIISAVLTILILIFSEIIPKTIGATYWRSLALPSGRIIQGLIVICFPLVWLSEWITKLITPKHSEVTVSREEFSAMADVGTEEGVFQTNENAVIQNMMRLETVQTNEVMTPRVVTIIADEAMTLKAFHDDPAFRPYSRIPVYEKEKDFITGYVLSKDILEHLSEGESEAHVADFKRSITAVIETESIAATFEKMIQKKEHIALVVNEYGDFEGIITMEDIVETILGMEIIDEKDTIVDMQQFARDKWKKRRTEYNLS